VIAVDLSPWQSITLVAIVWVGACFLAWVDRRK